MIYFWDLGTLSTIFQLDCEKSEERTLEVEWTDHPMESGFDATGGARVKPETFPVEGVLTAWPLGDVVGQDAARVVQADKALREYARKRQPITLITNWWAEEVVISKVTSKQAAGDGDKLTVSIDCRLVKTTTPTVTTVPPSRLKPSVKASSALQPKGGAGATQTPPKAPAVAKARSWVDKHDADVWQGQGNSGTMPSAFAGD